jgi:hypothetical protein
MKNYRQWLSEAFADEFGKNIYAEISHTDLLDYADDVADLIKNAYAEKGGNLEIKSGADLKGSDLTYWVAKDMDSDPEIDLVLGGKQTPHGTKMTVMGQDGSSAAKKQAVLKMIELMRTRGFYAEVDPDLADKLRLPRVKDEKEIRKVLNKEIEYKGDGLYTRQIGGGPHDKVMVGIPKD